MARDYIRSAHEVNPFLTISALAERVAENIVASLTHLTAVADAVSGKRLGSARVSHVGLLVSRRRTFRTIKSLLRP